MLTKPYLICKLFSSHSLEQNDNVYFFATNLDMNSQTDPAVRLEITRLCLQDLGLL